MPRKTEVTRLSMSKYNYFRQSSHRFYGAVVALFMLLLYETLVIWGELPSGAMVRNAPEVWLRSILYFIGLPHYYISLALLAGALIAISVFYQSGVIVRKSIFFWMILESIFWGLVSGFIIQFFMINLPFFSGVFSNSILANLGLAIGAGLFEELLFRVVLTTFLIYLFRRIFDHPLISIVIAVLVASFLFSLVHYLGNMADQFTLYSFMFRFFAGIWFTTLYTVRGFAITCMTHAFYDIFVIFFYQ